MIRKFENNDINTVIYLVRHAETVDENGIRIQMKIHK